VIEAVEPDQLEPARPEREVDVAADLVAVAAVAVPEVAQVSTPVTRSRIPGCADRCGCGCSWRWHDDHAARTVPLDAARHARELADELDQDIAVLGQRCRRRR
jgi:hypothetical protein